MPSTLCARFWACSMSGRACHCSLQTSYSREQGLEKEKTLPAARFLLVWDIRNVRKVTAFKGRQGIFKKKRACFFLAKLLSYHVVGGLQAQRSAPRIVCVTGHQVH